MNILHINTEKTWRGGEQQTLYLAEGLAQKGIVSEIACQPGKELEKRARAKGLAVHPVPMKGEWDLAAVFRLRSIIRKRSIDIVHMHTSHGHTLGVAAARLAGGAKTVVARRVDFSIYRHPFSLSGLKYKHGVDRYVAVSRAIKDVLARDGIDPHRIEVVHSGIDPSRFEGADGSALRNELGVPGQAPVIGTVAHFAWHKGLEILVDAVPIVTREAPEAVIVIVGEGSMEKEIKERAAKSGAAKNIIFTGFRKDIPQCLAFFDVFVMPSHMEGLCTSILDALVSRKPVAASKVGGIPEIIEDNETGLLVPPGDPAALAESLVRLVKDRDLAARLAGNGRRKVMEEFTIDAMVKGNMAVYERLLAENEKP